MENLKNILVVINRSQDSKYVLEKTAALADAAQANVHVIRVIHEDIVEFGPMNEKDAHDLKIYLMQSEETYLEDLVEDHRTEFKALDTATIWHKRVSQGAIDIADRVDADLIVKAVDADSPHFPRHPDDWNLLRHAQCPVMMVKQQAWVDDPVVLVAVDSLDEAHADMNQRVLRSGAQFAGTLKGRLDIVNAYPMFERWAGELGAAVDVSKIQTEVEEEATRRIEELTAAEKVDYGYLHVREGKPAFVIRDVAGETNAELIVMGTAGRGGVIGYVIGNTSETLLHLVDTDVLILHV